MRQFFALLLGLLLSAMGIPYSVSAQVIFSPPTQNTKSPLGINLSPIAYYSTEQPFLNFVNNGTGWIPSNSSTFDTGEGADICLSADGWPVDLSHKLSAGPGSPCTTAAAFTFLRLTLISSQPAPYYPAGNYDLYYSGTCGVAWEGDATGTGGGTGHDVITIVSPSATGIILKVTNVSSGGTACKNISFTLSTQTATFQSGCIWGGAASAQVGCFNPKLLAAIAPFSTLRFMDWLDVNGNTDTDFSTRPTTSIPFYANGGIGGGQSSLASGVPLERAIALCNINGGSGSDCWINVPALYSDTAVTSLATLVHTQLKSSLKVYVEASNEVWNAGMLSYSQYVTLGRATFAGSLGSDNDYALNYYGYRAQQICALWKTAWATDSSRVACVYGAQAANTYSATEGMSCPFAQVSPVSKGSDCSAGIDVIAIAPYLFGDTPSAWTAQPDGGLSCYFNQLGLAQACPLGRLPTGNGNATGGTASALTLTSGLGFANPPPNGSCTPIFFSAVPNNGATLAVDGGTPHALTDNDGGNVSNAGVSQNSFLVCYTSQTAAGSVTQSWRVLSFQTLGVSGGWLGQLNGYIANYATLISGTYPSLKLVTYEGGEQMINILNSSVLTTLYNNASADFRMGTVYNLLMSQFKHAGGHVFVEYFDVGLNGQFGNFGALTTICNPNCTTGTPSSAKYNALRDFIATNPKTWSFPYLLRRDIGGPANDNSPMWTNKAA